MSGGERRATANPLANDLLDALAAPPGPVSVAARGLGDAMRLVIDRLATTGRSVEELTTVTRQMEAVAAALASSSRAHPGSGPRADAGRAFVDWSPLLGRANPLAPPIVVETVDGRILGRVRFGSPYEGPPGCVHGGCIAAGFDEVLGLANSLSGAPAMTGTLSVRYRHPTPLETDLVYVGVLLGVSGRRVRTHGELWSGQVMTAEADGLFVRIGKSRFAELRAASSRVAAVPDSGG